MISLRSAVIRLVQSAKNWNVLLPAAAAQQHRSWDLSSHIRSISTTCTLNKHELVTGPQEWPMYNKKMFPIQGPNEERRPAFICHMNINYKYSPDKLWYIATLIRGMSIDEAIRQIQHIPKKGAWIVHKTLLEAQDLAVKEHGVEFRSNLWVGESFCTKGMVIKGMRRHARKRHGIIKYKYSHYFVRLEEGLPPADYYNLPKRDAQTLLQNYIAQRRDLRVANSI